MKRDMDLVRKLLIDYESSKYVIYIPSTIKDHNNEDIRYHLKIMSDAGLLEEYYHSIAGFTNKLEGYRLTWFGHDFLDASREESRWNKAKEIGKKAGGISLEVLTHVLNKLMMGQVDELLQ